MKGIENLALRETPEGVIVSVKVVPGASRDRIAGVLGDALKITTSAPPEKGRANAAVARTLARALGVGRRAVEIVSGRTSPRKEFRVSGVTGEGIRATLRGKS